MIPVMRGNLAALGTVLNGDGLLEGIPTCCAMFVDWASVRTDGVSVLLNGLYAKTLDETARLERLAGDATHADEFAARANRVRSSLNRYCPGDTFYPDVLLRNEKKGLVQNSWVETGVNAWGSAPDPGILGGIARAFDGTE